MPTQNDISPETAGTIPLVSGWKVREAGTDRWFDAKVPGCNFTDLVRNGTIKDPFYRDNELAVQWVEERDWEYLVEFNMSPAQLDHDRIKVIFEGLDTYADIFINDTLIFTADNMFLLWQKDIVHVLQHGTNTLRVYFHSPLKIARRLKDGISYPAGNDHSQEKLSVYTRKAPYHYGWDWGPRLVCSGVWRQVFLQMIDHLEIKDILLRHHTSSEKSTTLEAQIDVCTTTSGELEVHQRCTSAATTVLKLNLKSGDHTIRLTSQIDDCKKWWPNGMGNPNLYEFEFDFYVNGKFVTTRRRKYGFSSIRLVRDSDRDGESFYFTVNDHPVYIKGVNYIPAHSFPSEVNEETYIRLFRDMVAANMNMVRVWGGGIYECDRFYELADQFGIMVWQDFMFACTLYPGGDAFLANVEREAEYNIQRLRNYAGLALWCGNNEIEAGIKHWNWQEDYGYSDQDWDDLNNNYQKLFHKLLPEIIAQVDPDRSYLSSSPISTDDNSRGLGVGDRHYWGVWHEEAPFESYQAHVGRFMSEYGFQSFPLMESVEKYTRPTDRSLDSQVMDVHQKHPRGNALIKKYLLANYREPVDLESFLYVSQLQQAVGLKIAIEAHRRAKPFCMGTMYWQLNDCWPVASWSGIDFYGRWKALHYTVKRAFEPVLVCAEVEDSRLTVFAVNDLNMPITGALKLELLSMSGSLHWSHYQQVDVDANASQPLFCADLTDVLDNRHKIDVFLKLRLEHDRGTSRNIQYFVAPKYLNLQKPNIHMEVINEGLSCTVTLQSDTLVKDLHLGLTGSAGNFDDNFIDLLPNESVLLSFPGKGSEDRIELTSLFHTYHK